MDKKLKRYTGFFILSIAFSFVFSVFNPEDTFSPIHMSMSSSHSHYDKEDFRMSIVGDTAPAANSIYNLSYTLNLRRCAPSCEKSTILIENNEKKGELVINNATVHFALDKTPIGRPILTASLAILIDMAGTIWVLVLIWRTIRNIRYGNVFVNQVIKDIEKLGIIMLIFFASSFTIEIIIYLYASSHFHFEGYQVVFGEPGNRMLLIGGTGLMLLSQIIGKGKELQEENDLTI